MLLVKKEFIITIRCLRMKVVGLAQKLRGRLLKGYLNLHLMEQMVVRNLDFSLSLLQIVRMRMVVLFSLTGNFLL